MRATQRRESAALSAVALHRRLSAAHSAVVVGGLIHASAATLDAFLGAGTPASMLGFASASFPMPAATLDASVAAVLQVDAATFWSIDRGLEPPSGSARSVPRS